MHDEHTGSWYGEKHKIKSCRNCRFPEDGVCCHVSGQNYGSASEIGDNFVCDNWEQENEK